MMSAFKQRALNDLKQGSSEWLSAVNARGKDQFQVLNFPGRKTEQWKYTNLRAIETGEYNATAPKCEDYQPFVNQASIPDLESINLVMLNGYFSAELSDTDSAAEQGLEIVSFAEASASQQQSICEKLNNFASFNAQIFAALNAAVLSNGIFVNVAAGSVIEKPIQVVHINTKAEHPYTVNQRLLVVLEPSSSATIIEQFALGEIEQNSFTNGVSEFYLGENASLRHYRLNTEAETAIHIGNITIDLQRNARMQCFSLGMGGKIKRLDINVHHRGEGAECDLKGIYLARNQQHIDFHTCIEHEVPCCTTREVFRGIVADRSRAVFNGRIHIHPKAQKTLAQLSNKNLLTSNKAEIDTKPELEIYADDVQCAHGATVAQLDEQALHYLLTRGISAEEARVMLSFAFINELVNGIDEEAIAAFLRPQLATMFADKQQLMRHLL